MKYSVIHGEWTIKCIWKSQSDIPLKYYFICITAFFCLTLSELSKHACIILDVLLLFNVVLQNDFCGTCKNNNIFTKIKKIAKSRFTIAQKKNNAV